MSSGERPIGAAKGKQSNIEALCQIPPPPPKLVTDSPGYTLLKDHVQTEVKRCEAKQV